MICNQKTKPEFTPQQIEECKLCKHASGNTIIEGLTGWCSLLGAEIKEKNPLPYPSLLQQAKSVSKAAYQHAKSRLKNRPDVEVEKIQLLCRECDDYDLSQDRCRQCGCHLGVKIKWTTSFCPIGTW